MNVSFEINLDESLIKKAPFEFNGRELEFSTYPDVFAYEKIDEGSALLLSKLELGEEDSVADLGCGMGLLGICASTLTKGIVKLLDIDPRAIAVSHKNIGDLGAGNAKAIGSDLFHACGDEKFDAIITNVPSHLTKEGEQKLMDAIADRLADGGTLWMVFQRRIKDLIKRQVKEMFSGHKIVAMDKKYIVMKVSK